jgi:predicted porin
MKKHLIAAAVAAAVVAPAAMAQSSVTIYGGVDSGIQIFDPKSGSSATSSAEGRIYSSRLGFRGTEDLGGGLTAGFILESRLGASSGTLGTAADGVFNREMSVSLSGGFGSIAFGRLDLSAAEGVDTFTSQMGNLGFTNNTFELAGDVANSFRYSAPSLGGVNIQVGYSPNAAANATAKPAEGEITSFSATYAAGKLGLAAGYTRQDLAAGDTKVTTVGARYDFGVARVGLFYGNHDAAATEVDLIIASAVVPLGNGLALHGSYRNSDIKGGGVEATDINLGVSKALSKRTTVYGIVSNTSLDNGTTGGSTFLLGASAGEGKRYMVNVVHTF